VHREPDAELHCEGVRQQARQFRIALGDFTWQMPMPKPALMARSWATSLSARKT